MQSVSVALCTYNGGQFLAAQLDCLQAQTHPPIEIVICDDRSTDDTIAVVTAFAARSTIPVRLERNDAQLGYIGNFLKAGRLCRGDLVAFCDQDDLWDADKLRRCALEFDEPDTMLVVHQALVSDRNGKATRTRLYDPPYERIVDGYPHGTPWPNIQGFTEVLRRELLSDRSIDDVTDHFTGRRVAHDQLAMLAALGRGKVVFVDTPLAVYRQHGRNVVGFRRCNLKPALYRTFVNRSARLALYAKAAGDRSAYLQRCASRPGASEGHRRAMELAYARLAAIYELRSRLYAEPRIAARMELFRRLASMGAYAGRDGWSLTNTSRFHDFFLGVFLRPLLIQPSFAKQLKLRLKS